MHEAFAVKVAEDVENAIDHLPGFGRRKRPAGQNLRKVLLGTLHHNIKQRHAADLAASTIKHPN